MKKLYYEDVHMTDFDAIVTECIYDEKRECYQIVLDQTCFFPEEGGQPADKGTLIFTKEGQECTLSLADVQIRHDIIYHYTKQEIPIGTKVKGKLDWERRFDFMQQHSGEHIISGLVHKYYGFDNVGFHLGLEEVTLDFNHVLTQEQLRDIEAKANRAIWENIPIKITYPSPEDLKSLVYRSKLDLTENVRIVTIGDYDVCACCAPHTDTTGQIGMVKITNVQSHRGGVRVNILCGSRALKDYTTKQDNTAAISSLISVKQEDVFLGTQRLKEENLKQKEEIFRLQSAILKNLAAALPSCDVSPHAILFTSPANDIAIRNLVNELTELYSGYAAIFWGNDTDGYRYIAGSRQLDCRDLASVFREKLNAKGGGKERMIQGNIFATREQILSLLPE